ncbi:hypothetical protein IRZ79_15480 [Pseudomonas putida]|nr:hypothetical protein [Pseudomonas putida]
MDTAHVPWLDLINQLCIGVPITHQAPEFVEATPSTIALECSYRVSGVDRGDHPKPSLLGRSEDVGSLDEVAIRVSFVRALPGMPEHDANRAVPTDVDIYKNRRDLFFEALPDCSSNAKKVEIGVTFDVEIDFDVVVLSHV